MNAAEQSENTITEIALVTHTRRPQWGVGLVTFEGDDKRIVQFQDGKLRTFKKGFFHLLSPVDDEDELEVSIDDVIDELKNRYGITLAARVERKKQENKGPAMTFKDQVRVFKSFYPGGFQDEAYVASVRRDPAGRKLKRLRDPAIDYAQKTLSREAMDAWIAESDWTAVHEAVVRVLRKTSLASPSTVVQPIQDMPAESHERFALALRDLLWGEGEDEEARFREWLKALEAGGPMKISWPLATVLPALVHPTEHVCVRRKAFSTQAREITPRKTFKAVPAAKTYLRYRKMAAKVWKKLDKAGLEPRDYMDVYQFIWETLRPKGQEQLGELNSLN